MNSLPKRSRLRNPVQRGSAPNRFLWPEKLIQLLGRIPDTQIADLAGVHRGTVVAERRRRGIPSKSKSGHPVEWTAEMISVLGIDSDRKVAEELGLSHSVVGGMRRKLGIPPFGESWNPQPAVPVPWDRQDLALLGTATDREVADALGRLVHTVGNKRRSLGIPAFQAPPVPIDWTQEMIALLGTAPDQEIATRFGISPSSVIKKRRRLRIEASMESRPVVRDTELLDLLHLPSTEVRLRTGLKWETIKKIRDEHGIEATTYSDLLWTPEIVARLGTVPDHRIGEELGIAVDRVWRKRRLLGIPGFRSCRRWEDHEFALLGTAPDEEVALQLGRTWTAVRAQRRRVERKAKRRAQGKA